MDGRVKSDGYKRKEENCNDDRRVNTLILCLLIIGYQKIKFHNENIINIISIAMIPSVIFEAVDRHLYKLTESFE